MSESRRKCPRCGREIPAGVGAGPCPSCMLGRAIGMVAEADDKPTAGSDFEIVDGVGEDVEGYAIGEVLGEGGFGTVYRALQERPVRREVALKVLKPGMESKQVIARFEGERQALALMDHVGIARVLDAGTTTSGRPFFAMDLVDGLPIDQFCEAEGLSLRARLELFNRVCEAVHHAHQRGIIHRDLKPSNILVARKGGEEPSPKVIDFGIAKATEHILSDSTVLTLGAQIMGTPEYMSPEQALTGGAGIDTRADVYSLGAVLYAMLTGGPPLTQAEFRDGGYQAVLRAIAETEPPRPSVRATTLGADGKSAILSREIAGDLDWIVLKALAKERDRRYSSVDQFAEDVGNLLANQPVSARPPQIGYLVGKFVRRNRAAVAAAIAILAALVIAAVVSTVMALRADKSAKIAEEKTREARATFSLADYRAAGAALESNEVLLGIAHLARAVRTDPDNRMAAFKLASTLSMRRFPVPVGVPLSHGKEVEDCRFDPSGQRAITQCRDEFLRVWDIASGELLRQIPSHRVYRRQLLSSADGSVFATCPERNKVIAWDARTLLPLGASLWHTRDITAVGLHPRGEAIAAGDERGMIHIWDLPSGKKRHTILHKGKTRHLLWHADGERLVSISAKRSAVLWDSTTGEELLDPLQLPGPAFNINALSDDRLVVTTDGPLAGERGFHMGIYDLEDFSLVGEIQEMPDWVSGIAVHPGGRMLATVRKGGVVQAWDLHDGTPGHMFVDKIPGYTGGVAFDPTGNRLAATFEKGAIRVWDVRTGDGLTFQAASSYPQKCAWSPDGNGLLACGSGEAWAWDLSDRRQQPTRMQHGRGLWHVTYSEGADKIATAQFGGKFQVWDAGSGTPDAAAATHGDVARMTVRTSLPSKSLAGGLRRHVHFARSSGRSYPLMGDEQELRSRHLCASPDGRWVARPAGATLRVTDLGDGGEAFASQPAGGNIGALAFTDDSKHLAAVADGGAMRVWSVGDWGLKAEIDAFEVAATAIAVATEPLRVVAGTVWGGVFLWDPGDGDLVRVREDDHTEILSLKIDDANGRLVVGTIEGVELFDFTGSSQSSLPMAHDVNRSRVWPILLDNRKADRLLTMDGRSAIDWDLRQSPPEPRRFGHSQSKAWALGERAELLACASRTSSALYDVTGGEALTPNLLWDYRIDTRNLPDPTACAISPEGRRLLMAANDGAANQWDLPPADAPTPDWLPDFAEALIGFALSERGESITLDTSQREPITARLRALDRDTGWDRWGRWFVGETDERAISPYSDIDLAEHQRRFVDTERADFVRHALRITPSDRKIAARLLAIREREAKPDTSLHQEAVTLRTFIGSPEPALEVPNPGSILSVGSGWKVTRNDTHIGLGALAYCPKSGKLYLAQRLRYTGGLFSIDEGLDAKFLGNIEQVSALAISPDGTQLVCCQDYHGAVTRYDIATGESTRLGKHFYRGDNDPMGVSFVPPGFGHSLVQPGELIHVDINVPGASYEKPPGPNRVFAWHPDDPTAARTLYEGKDLTHLSDIALGDDKIWLAVADYYYHSRGGIYFLEESGEAKRLTTSEPIWPVALCFDQTTGTLLASDRRLQRVVRIDLNDGSVEEIATGFVDLSPCGLAVRSDGKALYISDIGMATVYEIASRKK